MKQAEGKTVSVPMYTNLDTPGLLQIPGYLLREHAGHWHVFPCGREQRDRLATAVRGHAAVWKGSELLVSEPELAGLLTLLSAAEYQS